MYTIPDQGKPYAYKVYRKGSLSISVYFYVQVVCKYKTYITIIIYYNIALHYDGLPCLSYENS